MITVLYGRCSSLLLFMVTPTDPAGGPGGQEATSGIPLTILLPLVATIAFATALILYVRRSQWLWMPAAVGIATTQAIIVEHWEEAKYATLLNVILVVIVALSTAAMRFRTNAQYQTALLFKTPKKSLVVTNEMISILPQSVQRWMRHAGVVGKETPNKLTILERGMLRTKPHQKWMPFKATQHFTIDPPGFVWKASINVAPGIEIGGQDIYREGHGKMIIKPLYLFNAANGSGKEIDQGTLVRYLAEMAWFPQFAVSPYLRWQPLDDYEAKVTMEYNGVMASGTYFFNANGDVSGFEAKRYGDFGGVYRKEHWSVRNTGYATFNGVRIGNKSDVTWKLAEGDFHWLSVEVTDITAAS